MKRLIPKEHDFSLTIIYIYWFQLVQRFILEYHEEPVDEKLRFLVIPDRPLKIKFIDRK